MEEGVPQGNFVHQLQFLQPDTTTAPWKAHYFFFFIATSHSRSLIYSAFLHVNIWCSEFVAVCNVLSTFFIWWRWPFNQVFFRNHLLGRLLHSTFKKCQPLPLSSPLPPSFQMPRFRAVDKAASRSWIVFWSPVRVILFPPRNKQRTRQYCKKRMERPCFKPWSLAPWGYEADAITVTPRRPPYTTTPPKAHY